MRARTSVMKAQTWGISLNCSSRSGATTTKMRRTRRFGRFASAERLARNRQNDVTIMKMPVQGNKDSKSEQKHTNRRGPHGRPLGLLFLVRRLGLAHTLLHALGVLFVGASLGRGLSLRRKRTRSVSEVVSTGKVVNIELNKPYHRDFKTRELSCSLRKIG